jgi:replication factor C subunit 2/4
MSSSLAAAKGKAPANGATAEIPYELPWYYYLSVVCCSLLTQVYRVEKYRPNVLDDVVGNVETIERLKVIAKDGNCPHIIISVRNTRLSLC